MINRDGIQKILKISIFSIVILTVLIYISLTFNSYIKGPQIIIKYPENGSMLTTPTVSIQGQVLHIKDVYINNRPIQIDTDGNFKEDLLLFPGYNVSIISAKDKFNRITEYKLELVYQDKK